MVCKFCVYFYSTCVSKCICNLIKDMYLPNYIISDVMKQATAALHVAANVIASASVEYRQAWRREDLRWWVPLQAR